MRILYKHKRRCYGGSRRLPTLRHAALLRRARAPATRTKQRARGSYRRVIMCRFSISRARRLQLGPRKRLRECGVDGAWEAWQRAALATSRKLGVRALRTRCVALPRTRLRVSLRRLHRAAGRGDVEVLTTHAPALRPPARAAACLAKQRAGDQQCRSSGCSPWPLPQRCVRAAPRCAAGAALRAPVRAAPTARGSRVRRRGTTAAPPSRDTRA